MSRRISREEVLNEIEAMEKRLGMGEDMMIMDEPEDELMTEIDELEAELGEEDLMGCLQAQDESEAEDAEEEEAEKEASETAPGVEDRISQPFESLSEELGVDDIGEMGLEVVDEQTGYTARLKEASQRLDRVAEYLEAEGESELALRIDKISDALDQERESL